jgi:hypothetical protein
LRRDARRDGHAADAADEALLDDADRAELAHDGAGEGHGAAARRRRAALRNLERDAFRPDAEKRERGEVEELDEVDAGIDIVVRDARHREAERLLAKGREGEEALEKPANRARRAAVVLNRAADEKARRLAQSRTRLVDLDARAARHLLEEAEEGRFEIAQARCLVERADAIDAHTSPRERRKDEALAEICTALKRERRHCGAEPLGGSGSPRRAGWMSSHDSERRQPARKSGGAALRRSTGARKQ